MSSDKTSSHKHGIPVVPSPVYASPGHLAPTEPLQGMSALATLTVGQNVRLWRPGVFDICKILGWRWLVLGPCLLVVLMPFLAIVLLPLGSVFAFLYGIKLWLLAFGGVMTCWAWGVRNAVRGRKDIFCIHCGYSLEGSPERGNCPECGLPHIPGICEEYRKDPAFFRHRFAALRSVQQTVAVDVPPTSPPTP